MDILSSIRGSKSSSPHFNTGKKLWLIIFSLLLVILRCLWNEYMLLILLLLFVLG